MWSAGSGILALSRRFVTCLLIPSSVLTTACLGHTLTLAVTFVHGLSKTMTTRLVASLGLAGHTGYHAP